MGIPLLLAASLLAGTPSAATSPPAAASTSPGTATPPAALPTPMPPATASPTAPSPASPPGGAPATASRVLTLAEAVQSALAHQPQLAQATAGTRAAVARADEARSGLLPQVTGSASYTRETANFAPRPGAIPSSLGGSSSSWNTVNYYSFGATLSQLIYDFGQTPGKWRAAQASARAQGDSERATRNQVLLGVQTAFFTARAAKDLVGVARDTLANQNLHLRQSEGFVRAGTRPEIDLAQARTNVANAQVQLINARNTYETTKAQLNQAMGVDGPTDYDVASDTLPQVSSEEQPLEALVTQAVSRRPDYVALQEQARAQELSLRAVKGNYWPSLGFSTGVTNQGQAIDSTVWNWSATVGLTWNLFQGGLTRAQAQEAQANLEAARAQAEVLRQQVRVDVVQFSLAVRAGKEALAAAGQALVNAKEQLRLAEGRYRAGVGNIIELSDAQVALTSAAAQRVQAEYNLSTSRAQLLRALGQGLPDA